MTAEEAMRISRTENLEREMQVLEREYMHAVQMAEDHARMGNHAAERRSRLSARELADGLRTIRSTLNREAVGYRASRVEEDFPVVPDVVEANPAIEGSYRFEGAIFDAVEVRETESGWVAVRRDGPRINPALGELEIPRSVTTEDPFDESAKKAAVNKKAERLEHVVDPNRVGKFWS